jgi:hypothetical protein
MDVSEEHVASISRVEEQANKGKKTGGYAWRLL